MNKKTPWSKKRYLNWYCSQWTMKATEKNAERIYQEYLKRFESKGLTFPKETSTL